jgi:hypothetical protein
LKREGGRLACCGAGSPLTSAVHTRRSGGSIRFCSRYSDWATDRMIRGSNASRDTDVQTSCEPNRPSVQWVSSVGISVRGVRLTTHIQLQPRLRMSGAIPPLPYMVLWRGEGKFYLFIICRLKIISLPCGGFLIVFFCSCFPTKIL